MATGYIAFTPEHTPAEVPAASITVYAFGTSLAGVHLTGLPNQSQVFTMLCSSPDAESTLFMKGAKGWVGVRGTRRA